MLCEQTGKNYCKDVWVICAILLLLDRIYSKPVSYRHFQPVECSLFTEFGQRNRIGMDAVLTLKNGITDNDQGNNYVIMEVACMANHEWSIPLILKGTLSVLIQFLANESPL